MKLMQEFHLKQENHEIRFWAYDIELVEKIDVHNLSRIYIPECANISSYGKSCIHPAGYIPYVCLNCEAPHFQELLIDGWYVGDKNGGLTDGCYVATLQTGIRVPVPKLIYDAWKDGFSSSGYISDDYVIELE